MKLTRYKFFVSDWVDSIMNINLFHCRKPTLVLHLCRFGLGHKVDYICDSNGNNLYYWLYHYTGYTIKITSIIV